MVCSPTCPACNPRKVRSIFETLSEWRQQTSLPIGAIGAKIRLGNTAREQQYQVYLPVAEAAVGSLDYIVVHARHGAQRSREPPTWSALVLTLTPTLTLTRP